MRQGVAEASWKSWIALALTLALWAMGAVPVGTVDADDEIGVWGDPARLEIVGLRSIPTERILRAVSSDAEFAWESHPRASRDGYFASLQKRIAWGLQRVGHPDAHVDVRIDAPRERVVVTIDEGPHLRAGRVVVAGCTDQLADRLALWFTERTPPEGSHLALVEQPNGKTRRRWVSSNGQEADLNDRLWSPGTSAPFDEPMLRALEKHAIRGLANEGWDDARVRVAIERDDAKSTAHLKIEVFDLGNPSRITKINVLGGTRDDHDVVLNYLELAEGQSLSPERRAQLDHRLRASARFREHKIESRRRFGGDGVEVTITLVEYEPAPSLADELRPEEAAILRCRDWMLRHTERGEDLVVRQVRAVDEAPGITEFVVGGDRGMLLQGGKPDGRKLALCLGAGEWGVCLSNGGGAFSVPQTTRDQLRGSLGFFLAADPKAAQPHTLQIGFGVVSREAKTPRASFALDLQFAPAAMLAIVHEGNPSIDWSGHELTIVSKRNRVRLNARTGQVLELQILMPTGSLWELSFRPDELPRRLAAIRREAGRSYFDPGRPVTSLVEFLSSEAMTEFGPTLLEMFGTADPASQRRWVGAAAATRQLVASDAFRAFDEALLDFGRNLVAADDDFTLPLPDGYSPPGGFMRLLGGWALRQCDQLLARETWPSALSRTVISMYAGDMRFVQQDFARLNTSPRFGPLGNLAASCLFPHPQAAVGFARQGLGRLSPDAFRGDRDDLLANLQRGGWDLTLVRLARSLSAEQLELLGEALANDPRLFTQLGSRLRAASNDRAALQLLPVALDELWEHRLAALVERQLRARAELDTAAQPGAAQPGATRR